MTPSAAAALLELPLDASPTEIEAAYRRLSRAAHPDRFAGAPKAELVAAANRFVQLTDAREALLRAASGSRAEVAAPYEGYESASVAPRTWWILGAWSLVLLVGLAVSAFDFAPPASIWDICLRLIPIGVTSIAFAVTGRRGWLIAMAALALASIVITIVIASFGPLVAIELLLIPMLGLAAVGRGRMRSRARSGQAI